MSDNQKNAQPAPSVPDGWSIAKRGDGRIVVKSPSGDAWAWEDEHSTGTSNDFVYSLLSAMLAAAPTPAPVQEDVRRDAQRYRWLRKSLPAGQGSLTVTLDDRCNGCFNKPVFMDSLDAAIDAAMSAKGGE